MFILKKETNNKASKNTRECLPWTFLFFPTPTLYAGSQ